MRNYGTQGRRYCRDCRRRRYERNGLGENFPEYQRKYNLRERYGLTVQEYEDLFRLQGGRCAICRIEPENERRLCVDHNHSTGQIRGLLCDACNIGMSKYQDDPKLLDAAMAYLDLSALKGLGE